VSGVKIHRFGRSGWPQILDVHAGPTRRRILEKIAEIKPDLVHWHETYGLPAPCRDIPQLFTVHGFDSENVVAEEARFGAVRALAWKWAERRGFAKHRHLVSINPYVKAKIAPDAKGVIHEINNPLDERFFHIEHVEDVVPRVLCVGWISPRKNTLASVRSFAAAVSSGCEAKLVIAGTASDPAYLKQVKEAVDGLGIHKNVEFLGHIDHDRLSKELSRASVFLLPSLQENAPMAIAEAMAVGVPVVTSNRCGMPYMIDHGQSGFLVDPEKSADVAQRLTELLQNPWQRESFGACARTAAREHFHPDLVVDKTLQAYHSILAEAQPSSSSAAHPHAAMPAARG
jgi:glycosyltransferase involved in cell wall biosynthesis